MAESSPATARRTTYEETFDNGHGGWIAWNGYSGEPEIRDGVLFSRSPWWVDPNHAPPGAGYLHLLAYLHTHPDLVPEVARPNRFVGDGYSRDLTGARVSVRLQGQVELRGAQLVLLAQADVPGTRTNFVLTGQPFQITPDWSEQTVTLVPDPAQWVCLGSRHNRTDFYGYGDIADVLRDLNVDIILVLFPLQIVPVDPVDDIHRLIPDRDYVVDRHYLPEGEVQIDTVRIEYRPGG